MSGKRLFALIEKELREFYLSKAWILVLALPLFIGFLYNFIYREAEITHFNVAYLSNLEPAVRKLLTTPQTKLTPYYNLTKAKQALRIGTVDAVITDYQSLSGTITLLADKTQAKKIILLSDAINASVVRTFSTQKIPQIHLEYLNQTIQPRWLSIPLWLIQLILTVCLLQTAAAIADEKEKQTLHFFLTSPVTFPEYLVAKLSWSTLLGIGSIALTLLLTGCPANLPALVSVSLLGGLVYTIQALLIGLFSTNALVARTIATVVYLVSTFPMMVADLQFTGKTLLNVFPTFLIYRGLERAVLFQTLTGLTGILIILFLETAALVGITFYSLKSKADF